MHGTKGEVNVDRQKLRDAIKKDIIEHPTEFTPAKAQEFKSALRNVLPSHDADNITLFLTRTSSYVHNKNPADGQVSSHKIIIRRDSIFTSFILV